MKDLIEKYRLLAIILALEIIFLVAGTLSALTTERVKRFFSTEDMEFSYGDMEAVTYLDDGSIRISDGAGRAEAWRFDVMLPAGRYLVTVQYEAENIDTEHTYLSIKSPSNLLKQPVYFSSESTLAEGELIIIKQTDDIHMGVRYGSEGALSVKSISIVEMKRLYRLISSVFWFVLFDIFYLILFTDCFAKRKEIKTVFLCLVGIILFASMPMFMNYVPAGQDLWFHLNRITGIAEALREGQFPVRIYTSVNNGYGYPAPVFYGDILLYVPALLCIVGCPLYTAYRIYVIAINTLTCLLSYVCFGKIFHSEKAGIFGAFLYTCAAYRIINVYFRAAAGEYSAMTFFPLLLYAACLLAGEDYEEGERKKAWIWLSIGVSGLCQTHILSMEICFFFWVIFMLFYRKKLLKKQAIYIMLKALAATLILNLWFLIPFLQYFMTGEYMINSGELYRIQPSGIYLYQIFAIFLKGSGNDIKNSMRAEMPVSPGFSLILGLIVFIVCFFCTQKREERSWRLGKSTAVPGIIALWFSSVYCPWDQLLKCGERIARFFFSVQYPWRYLAAATLFLTATSISVVYLIKAKKGIQMAGVFVFSVLLFHVLAVGSFYADYLDQATEIKTISQRGTPLWMDTLYLPLESSMDGMADLQAVCGDGIQIGQPERKSGEMQVNCVNASQKDSIITLPLIYYPNYEVSDTKGNQLFAMKGENGRIAVRLPKGFAGTVCTAFRPSVLWRICEWISLFGFIAMIVIVWNKWNIKRK